MPLALKLMMRMRGPAAGNRASIPVARGAAQSARPGCGARRSGPDERERPSWIRICAPNEDESSFDERPPPPFPAAGLTADALRFGQFTLKSGRLSPYFFNAGRFDSGSLLSQLGACYADAIDASGISTTWCSARPTGHPLATAMACELAQRGRDLPLSFNRKEAKAHGEGGQLIGADMNGKRVLIVDDVITAGTAIREAGHHPRCRRHPAGIVVALDRQEIASEADRRSAAVGGRRGRDSGDRRGVAGRPA